MNDINWRKFDDKSWALILKNPHKKVLVQTEFCYRVDFAEYLVDSWSKGPYLSTACEKAIRFAFIS